MRRYDDTIMEREVLFVEAPGFLWRTGLHYGVDEIEVNEAAVRMLNKMTAESEVDRELVIIVETCFPCDTINPWSVLRGLSGRFSEIILADNEDMIVKKINRYIDRNHDLRSFLFIGSRNMESSFPMRNICVQSDFSEERAIIDGNRILAAENRWGYFYSRMVGELEYDGLVDDQIEKVVFLDVDGVLNDSANGPKIDETMVERLARIVNNTGAALILSSSWRWCYIRCMDADHPERNDDIEMLVELLDRYGMRIEGTTPIFFNGPYGRPFEVRTWLQRRARVKRFVILDDESFWQWNWLSDYSICTEHQVGKRKYECGLTEEDVPKAIAIMNR